jgi:uncharacterized membrane protein
VRLEVFSSQKSEGEKKEEKRVKITRFLYLVSSLVAKYILKWWKIYISYLVHSQIWLNLSRDDPQMFYIFWVPMDGHHFGYKQKFLKKPLVMAIIHRKSKDHP